MIYVPVHLLSLVYAVYMYKTVRLMRCCFLPVTMAVPPCYADLGKSAKDIFNKGYGMDACISML